jgi:hypothetical protein
VRFHKSAMSLCVQHRDHLGHGHHESDIDPRRRTQSGYLVVPAGNKLSDHLLGQSRARLGPGGDDDVIIAQFDLVPAC